MALIIPLACGLGWYVNRVRAERRAIAAVQRAGGQVTYDFEFWECGRGSPPDEPPGPRWLRSVVGDEPFRQVSGVGGFYSPDGPHADDSLLAQICHLPEVKSLEVEHGRFSDVGMRPLAGLRRLETLDLSFASIDDSGVTPLSELAGLRELFLGKTRITDAGLESLANLTALQELHLDETRITGSGLKRLERLTHLRVLNLCGTNLGDDGMTSLAKIESHESLNLSRTNITLRGLEQLRSLPKLEYLDVDQELVWDGSRLEWVSEAISVIHDN